jgi:16S rRNA G966 N2-methylase RsmD
MERQVMTITWTGEIHEAANLFPMIDGDEFTALVQDIRENGLIEPVWLTPDGALLDGRNRAAACKETGVALRTRVYEGDDPIGFVVSLNVKRRHLSVGQQAMLALQVIDAYEAEGRERKAQAGSKAAPGKPSTEKDGADLPHLSKRAPRARDRAANVVGISGRAVAQAKRVAKQAPDLADKVRSGELALDKAEKQVSRRMKEQAEQEAREITMAEVPSDASGKNWRMYHGDFRERLSELPDGSVDLIVTDPPYPAEFMPLWSDLSKHASRVLKPQGILVALTGAIMLPDVIRMLGENLNWGWMYVQPLPGANSRIMARHVLQAYKPWIAYSNGPWPSGAVDWHPDMLDASSRAKDRYRWEQDPNPAKMLIDALSPKGGTVLDPYTGTGSYGVAALEMDRLFIGIEYDADRHIKACERLASHE